ncbi:MAG: BsuBI/PstI family type II restriction endonuclease [Solirubrobacterales bacterium]
MNRRQQAQVNRARDALEQLEFDKVRTNERSALVLLALLDLKPSSSWSKAKAQLLGTTELMDWIAKHYGKAYKPNTRETIRRQTLHQFVDAGLAVLNPDDPKRPTNSPHNRYQVDDVGLRTLRSYGSQTWQRNLRQYLKALPGLKSQYAKARRMKQVPVRLPDGTKMKLTPGGQNLLLKKMVEDFCPRFTPGGVVLYVGDAGKDDPIAEMDQLAKHGVALDKHGKLPDLIVYLPKRDWLVLMEAASTHGPVDAKRHGELKKLFAGAKPGLVFVSCFPDREVMRSYLAEIAWETDAWCADNPSHLIHFNGERFLGPQ